MWIQTNSNIEFNLINFDKNNINLNDIVHALSNICRYTGHCERFYSVAEHTCNMVEIARNSNYETFNKDLIKLILIHDFTEAYLGDVSRPLKSLLGPKYKKMESDLFHLIAEKYNVSITDELMEKLKEIDCRMLQTERLQLFSKKLDWNFPFNHYEGFIITPYVVDAKFIKNKLLALCITYDIG